jgi:WD40 repeat protein
MSAEPVAAAKSPLLFLSHSGEDGHAAQDLAVQLRAAGLDVWLDIERLQPGDLWQQKIGEGLRDAAAVLIYIGRSGVARWVDFEVQLALDRRAKNAAFRVVPVLGPESDPDALPDFLKLFQWIDLRDPATTTDRLRALIDGVFAARDQHVSVLPSGRAPFRGLLPFDVDDAVLFFGRERETTELLECLQRDALLLVIGDSGSGKSSLVRAGLIPALLRGRFYDGRSWVASWRIAIARPADDPFGELAENLPDLAPGANRKLEVAANRQLLGNGVSGIRDIISGSVPKDARTLLLVDQFEELFTATSDTATRKRFIDSLLHAATLGGSRPVHVVLTMRADFYAQVWQHETLLERVVRNQYPVRQLAARRLRDLIERPLALAGAEAEAGLIDTILEEIGDAPGNLPILEHALDQLWQRRTIVGRSLLTHDAYAAIGRLAGALRTHANGAIQRLPSDAARTIARRILVDLTQFGDNSEDTRRRVAVSDLLAGSDQPGEVRMVLERLATERLITTSEQHAEIAHEALIRGWPEFRAWIDADREFARLGRRLLDAAREWERLARDSGALLGGARLAEAETWLNDSGQRSVPRLVVEFIDASRAAKDVHERSERISEARRLAHLSELVFAENGKNLELSALLAVESIRRAHILDNDRALRARLDLLPRSSRLVAQGIDHIEGDVSFSADGRAVTISSREFTRPWDQSSVQVITRAWDLATGQELSPEDTKSLAQHTGRRLVEGDKSTVLVQEGQTVFQLRHEHDVTAMEISPNGRWVATLSDFRLLNLWDVDSGTRQSFSGVGKYPLAISSDGRRVVTAQFHAFAQVWERDESAHQADLREVVRLIHRHDVKAVAFSPDGCWLASRASPGFSGNTELRVWDATSGREVWKLEHDDHVRRVKFIDDRHAVTASSDRTVRIWDIVSRSEVTRLEHPTELYDVAITADGNQIVTSSDDGRRLWDVASGAETRRLSTTPNSRAIALSPRDSRLAIATSDLATIQDVDGGGKPLRLKHKAILIDVCFSPDGRLLATGGGMIRLDYGYVRVWDLDTGKEVASFDHQLQVRSVVFSPDGRRVLSGSADHTARLWDIATKKEITRFVHDEDVNAVAFSSDGRWILTGSDKYARLWNAGSFEEVARPFQGDYVYDVAFSPDGTLAATAIRNSVLIHYVRGEDLVAQACRRLTRKLTPDEAQRYRVDELSL